MKYSKRFNGSGVVGVLIFMILISGLLNGCGISVPSEKENYIGAWEHHSESLKMKLVIRQDGRVDYERKKFNKQNNRTATTTISAPIQEFKGDDFIVGFLFLKTTFHVNKKPYEDGQTWKIVVDEVTLTKCDGDHVHETFDIDRSTRI